MEEKKKSKWWRRVKYLLQFTSSLNKENMDDIIAVVNNKTVAKDIVSYAIVEDNKISIYCTEAIKILSSGDDFKIFATNAFVCFLDNIKMDAKEMFRLAETDLKYKRPSIEEVTEEKATETTANRQKKVSYFHHIFVFHFFKFVFCFLSK